MAKTPQRPPARKASAQSNPAAQTLDKFGLMLTILVLLGGAVCLFAVTGPVGLATANTSFFDMGREDASVYNSKASGVKVVSLFNSGTIVHDDSRVDSAIIGAGRDKSLRVGDVLTMPGEGEVIEFIVTEVNAATSTALIFHAKKGNAQDSESVLYSRAYLNEKIANATLTRDWNSQQVRRSVHDMRQ